MHGIQTFPFQGGRYQEREIQQIAGEYNKPHVSRTSDLIDCHAACTSVNVKGSGRIHQGTRKIVPLFGRWKGLCLVWLLKHRYSTHTWVPLQWKVIQVRPWSTEWAPLSWMNDWLALTQRNWSTRSGNCYIHTYECREVVRFCPILRWRRNRTRKHIKIPW